MFRNCCWMFKRNYNRCMEKNDINMEQMKDFEKEGAIIVDIRSPQEYKEGHIDGAVLLPEYEIYKNAGNIIPNKNDIIIVYCGSGIRSKRSQKMLQRLGYTNVYNLYKGTENY